MKSKRLRKLRKTEFIKGYQMGYKNEGLKPACLHLKAADYQKGYYEAKRDYRDGEPPLY